MIERIDMVLARALKGIRDLGRFDAEYGANGGELGDGRPTVAVLDLRDFRLRQALARPRSKVALGETPVLAESPDARPHLFPPPPLFAPLGHGFRSGIFGAKREVVRTVMSRVGRPQREGGMLPGRMTKPKDPGPPPTRYPYAKCLLEIAEMTERLQLDDKAVHLGIGMKQTTYSKKASGTRRFTIEELGRIAEFFSGLTGYRLQGWPFVSYDACLEREQRRS